MLDVLIDLRLESASWTLCVLPCDAERRKKHSTRSVERGGRRGLLGNNSIHRATFLRLDKSLRPQQYLSKRRFPLQTYQHKTT